MNNLIVNSLLDLELDSPVSELSISAAAPVTSLVIMDNATKFNGAIYSGEMIWDDQYRPKVKSLKNLSIVFITGEDNDTNTQMMNVYREYNKLGVLNAKLIYLEEDNIPYIKRRKISQAIKFLDMNLPN